MKEFTVVVVLLVLVLVSGLAVVHGKHESRRLSMELQALQVSADELELEWQMLQLERSTLAADAAVDQLASSELRMVTPQPGEVKYIAR